MSQDKLHLTHYGNDYRQDIARLPDTELQEFEITSDNYLLPSNPVITKVGHPVRIAFFGLNAYSKDSDFKKVKALPQQKQNFTEWCQDEYNTKLFNVLQLWHDGLPKTYFTDDSAIYFSNFVKIVLRQDYFQGEENVEKVLGTCKKSLTLFKKLAKEEVRELNNNGCCLFICFGKVVYDFMREIIRESDSYSASENIGWLKERHFSYYRKESTKESIQAASKWLKNTKQA